MPESKTASAYVKLDDVLALIDKRTGQIEEARALGTAKLGKMTSVVASSDMRRHLDRMAMLSDGLRTIRAQLYNLPRRKDD